MIDVRFARGVYLPDQDLWLDPAESQRTAFISHAHSDHLGNHAEVILSRATSRLMAARLTGARIEHVLEFSQLLTFRGATLWLLPAGHIYGSAQLYLESGQGSLLYTGDFKLRTGQSAEPIEWRSAETLIIETTYGLPQYQFPPTADVVANLVDFCSEAIADQAVPVLFGYSLGKAQEILAALNGSGLRILLHPSVYRLTLLYDEMLHRLPPFAALHEQSLDGAVLICPPGANRTRLVQKIKNRRTAVLTGWALEPGAVHRYQCDAAFPLSDHADYPDLIRYVELVAPRRVLTLHGFAREFAEDLRRRGIEAWTLGDDNQLELSISLAPNNSTKSTTVFDPDGEFKAFTALCENISAQSGKLEKVRLLSEYLKKLDPAALPIVAIYLTGHVFARSTDKNLQVGWAVIKNALLKATGLSESEFRRIAAAYGDAGKVAFETLLQRTTPRPFTLQEIDQQFSALDLAKGPLQKTAILGSWLSELNPLGGSYVIRLLTGDLRIGLKEGLVEEAIAAAFAVSADDVREAHMLTGNLGETALLARSGQLAQASVSLYRPIKCMLAIPEPSAKAAAARIQSDYAGGEAFGEAKYDGIRAQFHFGEDGVRLFSRDLRNITTEFPELAASRPAVQVILDGEILAYAEGKKLTFFDLQRRLGRKRDADLFETDDVPVIFIAFDLLWLEGESLLRRAWRERRKYLEALRLPSRVNLSLARRVQTEADIELAFGAARQAGAEGLMLKDPASLYLPGRRGGSWIKLKKALATLDVVVVGAELGHGKRSHVLSDYTFAVRDEATDELKTIGKAYSGLTDAEIEELTEHFISTTLRREGRFRQVIPEIVLEVAFDLIQPSTRHSSGLAMRFPRIVAIRRDKTAADIDTLQQAQRLAGVDILAD